MNMPASNNDLEMDSSAQGTYDGDFTETISNQMRMPQTLTVAEENGYLRKNDSYNNAGSMYNNAWRNPALTMEVPERIVVSMGERGVEFGEGKVDLPSPTYYAGGSEHVPVGLKTPPRVLTLHDTNLHSLDVSNRSEGGFENENVENSTKPLKVRPYESLEQAEMDRLLVTERLRRGNEADVDDELEHNLMQENSGDDVTSSSNTMFDNLQAESRKFYNDVVARLKRLSETDDRLETNRCRQSMFNHGMQDRLSSCCELSRCHSFMLTALFGWRAFLLMLILSTMATTKFEGFKLTTLTYD